MSQSTYYSILGVTPDAEDIVITAAYRALAQRYHPDKWHGDPSEAQQRMTSLNEAYALLRDPVKRSEYDRTQQNSHNYSETDNSQEANEAFDAALKDVEEKWDIACKIYPDLKVYRKKLKKISSQLAFSYVMYLIETKEFNKRERIYENMEFKFLERYFGSSRDILHLAKDLIQNGKKEEAKELNKIIDVMGADVNIKRIIELFYNERKLKSVKEFFRKKPNYFDAKEIAKYAGCDISEQRAGFFSFEMKIVLTLNNNQVINFPTKDDFIVYIKENFVDVIK